MINYFIVMLCDLLQVTSRQRDFSQKKTQFILGLGLASFSDIHTARCTTYELVLPYLAYLTYNHQSTSYRYLSLM